MSESSVDLGKRKLAAIMFTDMVGYSALSHQNEGAALVLLDEFRRIARPLFPAHGGVEIKTIGDAFLVEFDSALGAVRCSIDLQKVISERNLHALSGPELQVRIGIHLGDVVSSGGDVYGDGVNIASRIESLGEPGNICVSQQVYDQIHNKLDVPVAELGMFRLKNIDSPVRIYKIALDQSAYGKRARLRAAYRDLRRTRFGRFASGPGLAAAVALVFLVRSGDIGKWGQKQPDPFGRSPAAQGDRPEDIRLAVMPFTNVGATHDDDYLAQGLTDELIAGLAQVPRLRVISRSTVLAYRDTRKSADQVGSELKVGRIIEGSVRRSGDQLRVTLLMVDTQSQENVWTREFDGRFADVFALQRKIATEVARDLSSRLNSQLHSMTRAAGFFGSARVPGAKPELATGSMPGVQNQAYLLYLRGRYYMGFRTEEALWRSVGLFEKSAQLDPRFVDATVGLANAYGLLAYYGFLNPKEALVKGEAAGMRAFRQDPKRADVVTWQAINRINGHGDWEGGERLFRQAIELRSDFSGAHQWYGEFLAQMGRKDEAIQELDQALELDPLSLIGNTVSALPYFFSGDHAAAFDRLYKALELDPGFLPANYWLARVDLAQGKSREAILTLLQALKFSPESQQLKSALGVAYAQAGRVREARDILEQLRTEGRRRYVASFFLAMIHTQLGEKETALVELRHAVDEKSPWVLLLVKDPLFDSLRGEAGFRALLQGLKLPE